MIKLRMRAFGLLLAGTAFPLAAGAQTAPQDKILMRRVIDLPKVKPGEQVPPPPEVKAFRKVPTMAAPMTLTFPLAGGQFVFSTAITGVECRDAAGAVVSQSKCADVPTPATVGLIPIAASGNAVLRKIVFNPKALAAAVPTVKNVADLCESPVHINGQVWRLSCSPAELEQPFVKIPTAVRLPTQDSLADGKLTLQTPPEDVACVDTRTGEVAPPSACVSMPTPPNVGTIQVPVATEPAIKVGVVSRDAVKALLPGITDRNLDDLCSSTVRVGSADWKISCNPDDLRVHYVREATWAVAHTLSGATPTDGKAAYGGEMSFSTDVRGVVCVDTDKGSSVAAALCDSLPPSPGVGTISVPASYSPAFRTVVFDKGALVTQSPKISNVSELCSSTLSMDGAEGAPREYWYVRCDPAAISGSYVKVAKTVVSMQSPISPTLPTVAGPRFSGQIQVTTSAIGVVCRDVVTGKTATDPTRCAALANPPGVGQFAIPATFSTAFHRALVNFDDILKLSPEVANKAEFCSSSVTLAGKNAAGAAAVEGWSITCDPENIREHYVKVATQVVVATSPVSVVLPTPGKPDFDGEVVVTSAATGVICRDTDNGQTVDSSRCAYLSSPTVTAATVPGKFSVGTGKVYVDFDAVLARFPEVTNRTGFCASNLSVSGFNANGVATSETWRITCNPDDIRTHHLKVPTAPIAVQTSIPIAGPTQGKENFASQLNFSGLTGVMCRDTDTSAFVSSSFCDRLALPAEQASFKVSATFSPSRRAVLIDFDEVLRIIPAATNKTAVCASSVSITPSSGSSETWKVTCNPEDVRAHYEMVTADLNLASWRTTPSVALSTMDAGRPNFASNLLVPAANSYTCRDTDNGATVAQSFCSYAAIPANGASFEVPVIVSPSMRRVYVDRAALLEKSPNAKNLDAACAASVSVSTSGGSTSLKMTCNPEDVRVHYELVPTQVATTNITTPSVSRSLVEDGDANLSWTANLRASTTAAICRDTDDGKIVVNTLCNYVGTNPAFNLFQVPITISPSARKVLLNRSDIEKAIPGVTNLDSVCRTSMEVPTSNGTIGYTTTCNAEDVRLHYQKFIAVLSTGYDEINTNTLPFQAMNPGKPDISAMVTFRASTFGCKDMDNGNVVSNSLCNYVGTPSPSYFSVPGVASPTNKTLTVNRADIVAKAPDLTNPSGVCGATAYVKSDGGGTTSVRLVCNP